MLIACTGCGADFHGRADARYCSSACRQWAYRQRGAGVTDKPDRHRGTVRATEHVLKKVLAPWSPERDADPYYGWPDGLKFLAQLDDLRRSGEIENLEDSDRELLGLAECAIRARWCQFTVMPTMTQAGVEYHGPFPQPGDRDREHVHLLELHRDL